MVVCHIEVQLHHLVAGDVAEGIMAIAVHIISASHRRSGNQPGSNRGRVISEGPHGGKGGKVPSGSQAELVLATEVISTEKGHTD